MKKMMLGASLSLMTGACMATNPASVAYVDKLFSGIQAQIDIIKTNPALMHPVGSCYGGGVVYYVTSDTTAQPGQRGLIVAPTDSGSSTSWSTLTGLRVIYNETDPSLYFTGEQNTKDILATTGATWPAAQSAYNYNTTNPPPTCAGCTNWYLPSHDELARLYFQANNTTNFGMSCTGYVGLQSLFYWTSTQVSTNTSIAWKVSFGNGIVANDSTTTLLQVRAVRAF